MQGTVKRAGQGICWEELGSWGRRAQTLGSVLLSVGCLGLFQGRLDTQVISVRLFVGGNSSFGLRLLQIDCE